MQKDVEISYDYDLLLKALSNYQINRSLLTQEDFHYMTQLASVYSIDALTLAGFVKDVNAISRIES